MNHRTQLVVGAVVLLGGGVALWNIWKWAMPRGSSNPIHTISRTETDPLLLPPVGADALAEMELALLDRLPSACVSAGLSQAAGQSIADACAGGLPVLLGQGVSEHLSRSARVGATLNTDLVAARTEAFARRALGQLPADERQRWSAATPTQRYAMMIEHTAALSPKIAWIDEAALSVRPGALQWDVRDGQAYLSLGSVAHRWPQDRTERSVTVAAPVRFNDGRTGTLGFVCAPVNASDDSWVIGSVFVIVDSGRSLPLAGI